MGVWGSGPLDNDGAADLVIYVEKAGARGWSIVMSTLRSLSKRETGGPEFVGRGTHERVAAAELVATALNRAHRRDDRHLAFFEPSVHAGPWAKRYAAQIPAGAPDLAVRAVRAAMSIDLGWRRPEDARRWQQNLRSLVSRLGGASRRSARSSSSPRARRRRSRRRY